MKKVCIIAVSLAKGGLERSCANLSILLSENGYEVHLVTLNDDIDYAFAGELFNLGKIKSENDGLLKRLARFKKLRNYFKQQNFDYIIDNRVGNQPWREVYYMLYIYGLNAKVVYMQHNGKIDLHFPKKTLISRMIINYAESFVGVSRYIAKRFNDHYRSNKCTTIYNYAIPVTNDNLESLEREYMLYLGRIDNGHKNISLLLEAYKVSGLSNKLIIMGDGPDLNELIAESRQLKLDEKVSFLPFSSKIYSIINNAKFLVLSSRYEGFPMVIVESLTVGTPVLSVDCLSGPSEIIKNGINGLLVENHSAKDLANGMQELYSNKDLYNTCKLNAKSSVSHLAGEVIVEKWKALLK